jgi:Protein of unknown function (DUF1573)
MTEANLITPLTHSGLACRFPWRSRRLGCPSLLGPRRSPPSLKPVGSFSRGFPLEISPEPVDLGDVDGTKPREATSWVKKTRDEALTLERIETSCPCVGRVGAPLRIGAGETHSMTVRFDPSSEIDFQGELGAHLTGYSTDGTVAFRTVVNLKVIREPELPDPCGPRGNSP